MSMLLVIPLQACFIDVYVSSVHTTLDPLLA